jgi:mevalonate kinase
MANTGFGKIILFGEHFVVYGIPAIASSIDLKIEAKVIPSKEKGIHADDLIGGRKVLYKRDKAPITDLMPIFQEQFKLTGKESFYLTIKSTVPRSGGLGSSAALVVAVSRAFNQYLNLNLTDSQINDIAFEAEKYFHQNPSGVDNTVATYGGLLFYRRNLEGGKNLMERLAFKKPVEVVLAESSIKLETKDTAEIIAGVRKRKEENATEYNKIFAQASQLIEEARKAVVEYNLFRVGELMNQNHTLLQKIEVSCPELDNMCKLALEAGAIGAKLTGTGRGGNIIALTPGRELQDETAEALENAGFKTIKTKIG